MLSKRPAEMGEIFKTAVVSNFADRQIGVQQQHFSVSKASCEEPFAGRLAVDFLKIAFESGEAAVAELGVFFEFKVVGKIILHDFPQGDGGRLVEERTEIGKCLAVVLVVGDVEEQFTEFEFEQCLVGLRVLGEIGKHRMHESIKRRVGSHGYYGRVFFIGFQHFGSERAQGFADKLVGDEEKQNAKFSIEKLLYDARAFAHKHAGAFHQFVRAERRVPDFFAFQHIHEVVVVRPHGLNPAFERASKFC